MKRRPIYPFLLLTCLLLPLRFAVAGSEPTVTLLASNATPYVGEELILVLEVRYGGRLSARPLVRWPALDNFVTEDLGPSPTRRNLRGGSLVESARLGMRPLSPGKFTLRGGVLIGDRFFPAPPLQLRVRSLPVTGRPEDFAGAVGRASMKVEDGGIGNQEITLTLEGNAPLDSFPVPLATLPAGARLILLEDQTVGFPGEIRQRRLRFRYVAEKNDAPPPLFFLSAFDPVVGSYFRLQTLPTLPRSQPTFLPAVIPIAVVVIAWFWYRRRRRYSLDVSLSDLLGRPVHGMSRQHIIGTLRKVGVPSEDATEIIRLWATEDRARFSANSITLPAGHAARQRQIASRLRKFVDKRERIS